MLQIVASRHNSPRGIIYDSNMFKMHRPWGRACPEDELLYYDFEKKRPFFYQVDNISIGNDDGPL
jgi:hypothetical protein